MTPAFRVYAADMRLVCLLLLALAACGPAPGYNAEGQYVADPNAGLASPRRDGPPDQQPYPQQQAGAPQSSGGQAPAQQGTFYDDMASASGQPAQQPQATCDDTCRFANNGECDDGREGSDTDVCGAGTDCADCGR
jgi:hypothetical protein